MRQDIEIPWVFNMAGPKIDTLPMTLAWHDPKGIRANHSSSVPSPGTVGSDGNACSRGSASEEELPAARAKKSLQAARARSKKTRKKKQEARSIYRQQAARSQKQQARKQQAAGRQVRELVFLSIQKATLGRRLEDSSES